MSKVIDIVLGGVIFVSGMAISITVISGLDQVMRSLVETKIKNRWFATQEGDKQ
jgi:energy-converting hydrogenase Eha subunit B